MHVWSCSGSFLYLRHSTLPPTKESKSTLSSLSLENFIPPSVVQVGEQIGVTGAKSGLYGECSMIYQPLWSIVVQASWGWVLSWWKWITFVNQPLLLFNISQQYLVHGSIRDVLYLFNNLWHSQTPICKQKFITVL